MNKHFVLINKQTKDISKEYLKHYEMVEKIMSPLVKDYSLGAATRLTQKYFMDHDQYPIMSFAHEDGIVHMMFDDGMSKGEDDFLEDMLNMLIDKGEFIEKTQSSYVTRYYKLLKQLKELKTDMKTHIVENYKKNKGKGRKQW